MKLSILRTKKETKPPGYRHGVEIKGNYYPAANSWKELSVEQRKQARFYLNQPEILLKDLQARLLMVALDVLDHFNRKLLFQYYVRAEEIHQMLPLTDFFFKEKKVIRMRHNDLVASDTMSFVEFLRLDTVFRKIGNKEQVNSDEVLAIRYRYANEQYNEERQAYFRKCLLQHSPNILVCRVGNCYNEYKGIVDSWPDIFKVKPQKESNVISLNPEVEWFKVVRELSNSPLEFEKVALLPINTVLFEISQRLRENKEMKKN